MSISRPRPLALVILDGWGLAPAGPDNAVHLAATPVFDRITADHPHATLRTSGRDVGLPAGQMGNSEVGHLNLGAGFVVEQDLVRIDREIEEGSFFENPALLAACDHVTARGSALHLLGLVGDGGVHAHARHLTALLELARRQRLDRVYVHAFTDGRDTAPDSGLGFMTTLQEELERLAVGRVATVTGRYYAMDRDQRWERTALAWAAVVEGEGESARTAEGTAEGAAEGTAEGAAESTAEGAAERAAEGTAEGTAERAAERTAERAAERTARDDPGAATGAPRAADGESAMATDPLATLRAAYAAGITDEFLRPTVLRRTAGEPVGRVGDGDAVVCFNFRADRMRQLLAALTEPAFDFFPRRQPADLHVVTFTEYRPGQRAAVAFPRRDVAWPLARVLAEHGLRQLHAAETEKYAHVTYFFNGGREAPLAGEERLLVPSPQVATYDLAPAMSAVPLTDALVARVLTKELDFLVVNYANPDMVGHTGDLAATVAAVEAVDACLGRLLAALAEVGGAAVVTSDHGNAEMMRDPVTGGPHTAHTLNPVPLVVVGAAAPAHATLVDGRLCDVAPTLLALLHLPLPADMTGQVLLHARGEA